MIAFLCTRHARWESDIENHFGEGTARAAVASMFYTDKAGKEHKGEAHWTPAQVEEATGGLMFPPGTTHWDKWVAFNVFFADTCKVLDEAAIIKAAHAFFFADEDAPAGKVARYVRAMEAH